MSFESCPHCELTIHAHDEYRAQECLDRVRRDLEAAAAALKAKDIGLYRAIGVLEDIAEDLAGATEGVSEALRGGLHTTAEQALPLIRQCHEAKPGALPDWFVPDAKETT